MRGKSSGMTSMASMSAPASSARWASNGPAASSARRRATDVEIVRTAVRIGRHDSPAAGGSETGGRLAPAPGAAAAARLFQEHDLGDLDAALEPLDHVVDGQRGDGDGGHRLHLDARASGDARLRGERDRPGGGIDLRVDVDVV